MSEINNVRRRLLKQAVQLTAIALGANALPGCLSTGKSTSKSTSKSTGKPQPLYRISLAQWSLHRAFRSGDADPLDFARIARQEFDIHGIEYVNQFYADTLNDRLVEELRRRADSEGVDSLLIMIDQEGALGDPDARARQQSVGNHHRWADAAHALGCHSIRVNAQSSGSYEEQMQRAADGLVKLAEYCDPLNLNVLVENHGGLSSNAAWLSGVMELADHPRVGTLPDFGNFVINRETGEEYDKYRGVEQLMPYARAVSAKSFAFDNEGRETTIDFERMMRMVVNANYRGWVGVEYEGDRHSEAEGIRKTRDLLLKIEAALRTA